MKQDLKASIRSSIKSQDKVLNDDSNINTDVTYQDDTLEYKVDSKVQNQIPKLKLGRKKEQKESAKPFQLYLKPTKSEALDKICKKTGYSKNELINILIDFGLEHLELDI